MSTQTYRFDTREAINAAIAQLVARGVPLDDVDVALSQIGLVDLDLCVECLKEMAAQLASQEIADAFTVAA